MELTKEDLQILQAPFAFDDHEFINGFVYIREDAIMARIEEVDPGANIIARSQPLDIHITGEIDLHIQVSVIVDLTVCNVTRSGIGTANVVYKQYRDNAGNVNRESIVNEAYKSAVTDALKRAARLFGVGRYLLQAPKERDFARWLSGLNGQPIQSAPNNQRRIPQPQPTAQGEVIKTIVTSITKKTSTNGNAYMVVATAEGHNITVWSWSETFGLAGYTPEDFADNDGVLIPTETIEINIVMGKRGYYDISQIAPKS